MGLIVDTASDEEMRDINQKYMINDLKEKILKTYTIGKTFRLYDIFNLCVTNPNYDDLNKCEKQKICYIAITKLLNDKIIEKDPLNDSSYKEYIVVKEIQRNNNKQKKEDYEK